MKKLSYSAEAAMLLARRRIIIYAVVLGVAASAWAVPILDQESLNLKYTSLNVNLEPKTWQQEVTVGLAGPLVQIELYVTTHGTATIYINAGAPWQIDTDDFTTTFTATSNGWVTIDTSSAGLVFDVNDHFVIGADATGGGLYLGGTNSSSDSHYDRGQLWYQSGILGNGNWDFSFRTYVDPLPEPTTICLFGLGALSLVSRKKQEKK